MPSLLQQQDLECITSPGQMSSAWSGRKSRNNQSKTINTKLRAPNHTALSACLTAIAHDTTMLYLSTSIVLLYQNVLVSLINIDAFMNADELRLNYAGIMLELWSSITIFVTSHSPHLGSVKRPPWHQHCPTTISAIYLFIYSLRNRGSTNIQNKTQSKNTKHDCDGS